MKIEESSLILEILIFKEVDKDTITEEWDTEELSEEIIEQEVDLEIEDFQESILVQKILNHKINPHITLIGKLFIVIINYYSFS